MSAVFTAICERELSPVPTWVHLLPLGAMTGRDGRQFVLDDPQSVLTAFNAAAVDLAVDYEHQAAKPATAGPVPAAGWIKELIATASGIWGRVEWTAKAQELISAKEYRYVSPEFQYRQDSRQITRLKGAGLVHRPNLQLTALAAQEDTMPDNSQTDATLTFIQRLAGVLGISPDADADTILVALEKRLSQPNPPDPRKFAPVEAMAEVLADRNARIATMAEETAKTKVDEAFKKGYLTGAMKPWAIALCRDDPDSFDTFMRTSAPAYAHLLKTDHFRSQPPSQGADKMRHGSVEGDAICAQLGLPAGSLND